MIVVALARALPNAWATTRNERIRLASSCQSLMSDGNRPTTGIQKPDEDAIAHFVEYGKGFFASPRLIFQQRMLKPANFAELTSQELDFHSTPWDSHPTDVTIGFDTNSAWDIAVRKKSQELIVADPDPTPLMAQELIHRPLFHIANSPADYVALLFGIDLPTEMQSGSFATAYHWIMDKGKNAINSRLIQKELVSSLKRVTTRITSSHALSELEKGALLAYLSSLADPHRNCVGPIYRPIACITPPFPLAFIQRYLPESRGEGLVAPDPLIEQPYFSFLSSQEAFGRLKRLMTGQGIGYAVARYDSRIFYETIRKHGDTRGYTRYTISLSNVIDVESKNKIEAMKRLREFREMIYSVFPEGQYEVILFVTTNTDIPHGYLRLERHSVVPVSDYIRTRNP
jgi:hypothetical protein